ncbi:MAG: hypothetical protein ACR2KX_14050 [Chitinophagaceae bacterium]
MKQFIVIVIANTGISFAVDGVQFKNDLNIDVNHFRQLHRKASPTSTGLGCIGIVESKLLSSFS